jgi:hypothetical protein
VGVEIGSDDGTGGGGSGCPGVKLRPSIV